MVWKKGQSGNPKGTQSQYMAQAAKVRREVLRKFWEHGEQVLDRLAEEDPRAFMQVVLSVMKPGLEMEAAKEAAKEGGSGQMLVFGWRVVAPEGGPELPPPMLVREQGLLIEGIAEVDDAEQER